MGRSRWGGRCPGVTKPGRRARREGEPADAYRVIDVPGILGSGRRSERDGRWEEDLLHVHRHVSAEDTASLGDRSYGRFTVPVRGRGGDGTPQLPCELSCEGVVGDSHAYRSRTGEDRGSEVPVRPSRRAEGERSPARGAFLCIHPRVRVVSWT